jgi:hypothetical protein
VPTRTRRGPDPWRAQAMRVPSAEVAKEICCRTRPLCGGWHGPSTRAPMTSPRGKAAGVALLTRPSPSAPSGVRRFSVMRLQVEDDQPSHARPLYVSCLVVRPNRARSLAATEVAFYGVRSNGEERSRPWHRASSLDEGGEDANWRHVANRGNGHRGYPPLMPAASPPPTLEQSSSAHPVSVRQATTSAERTSLARSSTMVPPAGRWIRRILLARAPAASSRSPRSPGVRNDDEPCRGAHHVKRVTKQRPSLLTNAHPVSGRRNGAPEP